MSNGAPDEGPATGAILSDGRQALTPSGARDAVPALEFAAREHQAEGERPGTTISSGMQAALDAALLALLIASVDVLEGVHVAAPRIAVLFAAAALAPGGALLSRARLGSLSQTLVTYLVVSLGLDGFLALILIWSGWFHPLLVAEVTGGCSAAALMLDLARRILERSSASAAKDTADAVVRDPARRSRASTAVLTGSLFALPALCGLALWAVSLPHTHLQKLGVSGLLGVAPPEWYASLAVLLIGTVGNIWAPRGRAWLVALHLLALVLVVNGTIAALTSVPQYTYVYKHIGVISLLQARGHLSRSVDIYNRWPTMFAFAAALTKVSGVSPLLYANWVEPLFAAIDALIVAALGSVIARNNRIGGLSALLFICTNWVAQTYLSPQTFAFTLYLGLMFLVLVYLGRVSARSRMARLTARIGHRFSPNERVERFTPAASLDRREATALVLLLACAIASSHQLTPFVVLISLGVVVALGVAGSWWLWAAIALITFGWLAPNLAWLQHHYGLVSAFSFDLTVKTPGLPVHRALLFANAGRILSVVLLLAALLTARRLLRRGRVRKALPLIALSISPAIVLLAQNYGGEASLRVFLFAGPWLCLLAALGLAELRMSRAVAASGCLCALLLGLCLIATVGGAGASVVSKDELDAALYAEAHLPAHSVLELAGSGFPTRLGPRYPLFNGPAADNAPNLFNDLRYLARRDPRPQDLGAIIADMESYSYSAYLVFSSLQDRYAEVNGVMPPGRLRKFEQLVAHSSRFRVWYRNPQVRIYQLVPTSGGQ
jgi:hypothetical protein